MPAQTGSDLTQLPNIGATMARLLCQVGITTPAKLRRAGSIRAAALLAPLRPGGSSCRSLLCGLEGAIRGVRWHEIPKPERDALWQRFEMRNRSRS
jgi:DNA transformation protein